MKKLKLGILGLSEGNGHPYSWSAIFNGYDPDAMKDCGFPVIPEYLSRQTFPQDAVPEAEVTHIWTQDPARSGHIAQTCRIANVVDDYREMVGRVDAVLLARDDAEHHYEMAAPFLKAGLPVYIDKPLAYDIETAEKIYALEKYPGQIFTCSALAYAKEFHLDAEVKKRIGTVKNIESFVIKGWDKYSVHIIEPVLRIAGEQSEIVEAVCERTGESTKVTVRWQSGLTTSFTSTGKAVGAIRICLHGENGEEEMVFADTFFAFKAALQKFVNIVRKKDKAPSKVFTLKVIQIIESGLVHV